MNTMSDAGLHGAQYIELLDNARVAELVDATGLGPVARKGLGVRVPSRVP